MEVQFLTLDEVLEIHRDQIERYGGASGVRDFELFQSAMLNQAYHSMTNMVHGFEQVTFSQNHLKL